MIINLSLPMIDHLCVCVCVDSGPHEHLLYTTVHPHHTLHYCLAQSVCQRRRCHIKVMCLIINSGTGLTSSHLHVTLCLRLSVTARSAGSLAKTGPSNEGCGVCLTVCVCLLGGVF